MAIKGPYLCLPLKSQQYLQAIKKKLGQSINRKNALIYRMDYNSAKLRKVRTRTLIQSGGLMEKARLFDLVALETEQHLQKDPETFDAAVTLMGALLSLKESFLSQEAEGQKMIWKVQGKKELATRKNYSGDH